VISPSVLHGAVFVGVATTWSSSPSWSRTPPKGESTSSPRGGSTKSTSSTSQPHTVSQEPFRKDGFRRGSGACVSVFLRFGGRILSPDGKPGDSHHTRKTIRLGVGEEKRVILRYSPKRVVARGGSRMPNSSSIIEIVVECRRAGAAASILSGVVWD
jgi:hypothetical protein